jgi:hypothetical protein
MPRKPLLRNTRGWFVAAIIMFVFSCWIFYDLHEARGGKTPLLIRMFTPT